MSFGVILVSKVDVKKSIMGFDVCCVVMISLSICRVCTFHLGFLVGQRFSTLTHLSHSIYSKRARCSLRE